MTILSFELSIFLLRLAFSECELTDAGCIPRVLGHSCRTPILQDICVDCDGSSLLQGIGTHTGHIYLGIDAVFNVEKLWLLSCRF